MSNFILQPVDVCTDLTFQEFQSRYFKPSKPVIMKDFSANWLARDKWTLAYFKQRHGDALVPVYDKSFVKTGKGYTYTGDKMRFADYLDLIASTPTQYRMFAFNIFKHMPDLCADFSYPPLVDHFVTKRPFMFFGGATSYVDVHFDVDLSDIFLSQFHGKKRVVLFPPEDSKYLYRHPFTASCNVDFGDPDLNRYPLLTKTKGYECEIDVGDTLFIPSGYWHYIYYTEGGFTLTLRAKPQRFIKRLQAVLTMFNLVVLDYSFAKIIGSKRWFAIKEKIALYKASRLKC